MLAKVLNGQPAYSIKFTLISWPIEGQCVERGELALNLGGKFWRAFLADSVTQFCSHDNACAYLRFAFYTDELRHWAVRVAHTLHPRC